MQEVKPGTSTPPQKVWWHPIWELVVHVWVGSLLFAILFLPALGLDVAINALKQREGVSEVLTTGLTIVKYVVFVLDCFLYLALLASLSILFLQKLTWRVDKHG